VLPRFWSGQPLHRILAETDWLGEACEQRQGSVSDRAALFACWAALEARSGGPSHRIGAYAGGLLREALGAGPELDELTRSILVETALLRETLREPAAEIVAQYTKGRDDRKDVVIVAAQTLAEVSGVDAVDVLERCLNASHTRYSTVDAECGASEAAPFGMVAASLAETLLDLRPGLGLNWSGSALLEAALRNWAHARGNLVYPDHICDSAGRILAPEAFCSPIASGSTSYDFFIIYERANPVTQDAAIRLRRFLTPSHPTFVDEPDIASGDRWMQTIQRALTGARAFVFLAPASPTPSPYIEHEIAHAVSADRAGRAKLFVVNLEARAPGTSLPYPLDSYQALDAQQRSLSDVAAELIETFDATTS